MRRRLKLPSPAMVVACIALAVALSGASYAAVVLPKNSVGTKQLKKNAVTTKKIRNNAVTGAKVNEATLGQVPSAANADNAANAVNAQNAANADKLDGMSSEELQRAFAYGQVRADGSLRAHSDTVVEDAAGNVGHPATGLYCISFTRAPTQAQLEGSAVTLSGTSFQAVFPHITNGQGSDCGSGQLAVRFFISGGTMVNARFMFIVP